ncbi:hypothetical protein D3C73_1581930 [compost metagenome]
MNIGFSAINLVNFGGIQIDADDLETLLHHFYGQGKADIPKAYHSQYRVFRFDGF